jgi:hypothetical protein
MSNELIVAVVPSEIFMFAKPVVWDEAKGEHVRVESLVSREEWWSMRSDRAAILARFPNAIYLIPVPVDCVWDPPSERDLNLRSARAIKQRTAHAQACRKSLQGFLNSKLARLDHMVRTGWWILGKARVRLSVFESAP